MESSAAAAPYCRLYDAARQAIKEGGVEDQEHASTTRRPHPDLLGHKLDRMIEEAHHSSSSSADDRGKQQATPVPQQHANNSKRQRRDDEEKKTPRAEVTLTAQQAGGDNHGDVAAAAAVGEGGLEDKCLGILAEAFADDLDLLRKDEHFRGSAKNIAAMADMMRCLAGGLDSAEQKLLVENATR